MLFRPLVGSLAFFTLSDSVQKRLSLDGNGRSYALGFLQGYYLSKFVSMEFTAYINCIIMSLDIYCKILLIDSKHVIILLEIDRKKSSKFK